MSVSCKQFFSFKEGGATKHVSAIAVAPAAQSSSADCHHHSMMARCQCSTQVHNGIIHVGTVHAWVKP